MLRILINGAGGKMGRTLSGLVEKQEGMRVVAGVDKYALGVAADYPMYESLGAVREAADVLIDFSRADALPEILTFLKAHPMALVIATTGYSEADMSQLRTAARDVPVFRSANMSLGVNLMRELLQKAAVCLGDGCDIEIVECHHNTKVDAPSGTALMLADAINQMFHGEKQYMYGRHTKTDRRQPREIGIHALRGGTVTGEHTAYFYMPDEVLEIKHSAQSRALFATGALRAARYIAGKPPKLYDMQDMLEESSLVTNLYVERDVLLLTMRGLQYAPQGVAHVFSALAEQCINLDIISQSAPVSGKVDLSFTLSLGDREKALATLAALPGQIESEVEDALIKLTVEGVGMERQPGVAARVFGLLARLSIAPRVVTTSETKISVCISQRDERRAVEAIRNEFLIKETGSL